MTTATRHPSLGKKFRDPITSFEGTAIARCEYLSGCFHLELERADKDGKPESYWFDEQRLNALEDVASFADEGESRSPGHTPPGMSHP